MVPRIIMVATDASENAKKAELFAAELASTMQRHGTAAGAHQPAQGAPPDLAQRHRRVPIVRGAHQRDRSRQSRRGGTARGGQGAGRSGAEGTGVKVATKLIENKSPAKGILDEALSTGECKMIVVGGRGHGGLPGLLLGSVSSQVLHGAHCPVLIVKG